MKIREKAQSLTAKNAKQSFCLAGLLCAFAPWRLCVKPVSIRRFVAIFDLMKNLFLILLLSTGTAAFGQTEQPTFKRFPTVPDFRILLPDSTTWFAKKDLPRKKATLIMVFSPDCDHCKHETEQIIAHIEEFKQIGIVMATTLPFGRMKEFYEHYDLQRFRNIKVGRDVNYLLPVFYNMRNMPFLAFYDKKGNLIDVAEGSLPVKEVLQKFD
jgi:hypothetical protein